MPRIIHVSRLAIISGGTNVFPKDIQEIVVQHPAMRALFLTTHPELAWYSASLVHNFLGEPLSWHSFLGHSSRSCSSPKWLTGEVSAIRFRYSTSCRFKPMRTPLTKSRSSRWGQDSSQ